MIKRMKRAIGPRKPTRNSKKPTAVLAASALANANDNAYRKGGLAKMLMIIRIWITIQSLCDRSP